jgi:3-hydroxyacyl-[acyl-carrier-protein] dehydratase
MQTAEGLTILSRATNPDDGTVTAEVMAPVGYVAFDGHFPGKPILPAFAQVVLIRDLAAIAMKNDCRVSMVKKARFMAPIIPERMYRVTLNFTGEQSEVFAEIWDGNEKAASFRLLLEKTP